MITSVLTLNISTRTVARNIGERLVNWAEVKKRGYLLILLHWYAL